MIINTTDYPYTLIKAEEGKVLRRKGSKFIYGEELSLGYSYFIDGVKLDEPHFDVPEDFEEIDIPEGYYPEEENGEGEESEEYTESIEIVES